MPVEWDQLENEPPKAYRAFICYRDLPARERSLNAAYTAHQIAQEQLKAPGYWCQWSSEFRWPQRAAAYDAFLDAERRRAREASLRELESRRVELEIAEQESLEAHARHIDGLIGKFIDGLLEPPKDWPGDKPWIPTIAGRDLSGLARLVKERRELSKHTILGPREDAAGEDNASQSTGHGTFEWVKPEPPPDDSEPPSSSS